MYLSDEYERRSKVLDQVFDYQGDICIWEDDDPPDQDMATDGLMTHHISGLFNVAMAKKIVEGRETKDWMRPSQIASVMKNIEVDINHAMTRDLAMPIIAITLILGEQKDVFVIDGWHRLTKAKILGDLPVWLHVLNEEETERVTMSWSVTPIERT